MKQIVGLAGKEKNQNESQGITEKITKTNRHFLRLL